MQASRIYTIYKYKATTHKRQQKFCELSGWRLLCSPPQWGAFAGQQVTSRRGWGGPHPVGPWYYLTDIHPSFIDTVDANGPAWLSDPWPVLDGTDLASWPPQLWSFRLLYLSFWHFSLWIPDLLRVMCHQSHHRLFWWLSHLHERCLPLSQQAEHQLCSRAEWDTVVLVHRQLNPGIRELTVRPIEKKRVMIVLILLIGSGHLSTSSELQWLIQQEKCVCMPRLGFC